MAIMAGTAYCIRSFPISSVPNAVGVRCWVIVFMLKLIFGCKSSDFSREIRSFKKCFVFLSPNRVK